MCKEKPTIKRDLGFILKKHVPQLQDTVISNLESFEYKLVENCINKAILADIDLRQIILAVKQIGV